MRHFLLGGYEGASPAYRAVLWLGLLLVYSGAVWLLAMLSAASTGWLAGAVALLVCLVGALALGVGLCAAERWAWAGATCLAAVYAACAAAALALLGGALANQGNALSWQPLVAGLNRLTIERWLGIAAGICVGSLAALWILWRAQPEFDIPHRRTFTVLLHEGALSAAVVLAADLFLLYHAWLRAAG